MFNNTLNDEQIYALKKLFKQADALVFSAGAGMGVDSGLPDFRGNQGMWQAYPELGRQKIDFTSIANPKAFKKHPRLAWGFYGHRLDLYRKITPHQGFKLLKNLAEKLGLPYFVFTSNVDGQFQKAGFDDQRIYECHGSIHHLQCSVPCCNDIWEAKAIDPEIDSEHCHWQNELPKCIHCGALARPNILMFDDYDWISKRQEQQRQRLQHWTRGFSSIVVIEMGAGTAVPTVRYFSEQFAPNLIRINPREYQLPYKGGISIAMNVKDATRTLFDLIID